MRRKGWVWGRISGEGSGWSAGKDGGRGWKCIGYTWYVEGFGVLLKVKPEEQSPSTWTAEGEDILGKDEKPQKNRIMISRKHHSRP